MNESGASEAREVVVVGVDGSAGARAALRWAIAEARLRQARLRAVHAWAPDYGAGYLGGGYASMAGGYGLSERVSPSRLGASGCGSWGLGSLRGCPGLSGSATGWGSVT